MQTYWDMTIAAYWAWNCWDAQDSEFHSAQGAGGLGYGFPAAFGGAVGLAHQGRTGIDGRVLAVAGDGGIVRLQVVGAAVDLADCFWPTCDPLRAFARPATLAELNGGVLPVTHVAAFRLVDPDDAVAAHTRLVGDPGRRLGGSSWPDWCEDAALISSAFACHLPSTTSTVTRHVKLCC